MTATKRSIAALLLALTLFINVYKPVEHEQHAESPTELTTEQAAYVDDKLPAPKPVIKPDKAEQPKATTQVQPKVQPVSTVKPVQSVQPTPKPTAKPKVETYQASHYIASCSGCSGTTASGYNVKSTIYYEGMRILAADKSIPLYTKMRVTYPNGTSFIGIVIDRGGAIKTGKLDVLVASYDEAIRLGRQQVTVEFVK